MVFREAQSPCPSCRNPLAKTGFALCSKCRGAWVSEVELEERMRSVRGKHEFNLKVSFGPVVVDSEARTCPTCGRRLEHKTLGFVVIDRCTENHGLWFDAEELATVLKECRDGEGVRHADPALKPSEEAAIREGMASSALADPSWDWTDPIEAIGLLAWVFSIFE